MLPSLALVAAAGLLVVAWRWFGLRPGLLVDERGIRQRGLRLGWIRWDEIEGAYPPTLEDGEALRVKFHRRGTPTSEVRIDLAGAGIGPLELMQEILTRTGNPPPARPV